MSETTIYIPGVLYPTCGEPFSAWPVVMVKAMVMVMTVAARHGWRSESAGPAFLQPRVPLSREVITLPCMLPVDLVNLVSRQANHRHRELMQVAED